LTQQLEKHSIWEKSSSYLDNVLTDQDIANLVWQRDDAAKKLSQKLGIDVWVSVNQYVTISWETWHDLDDLTKRAIGLEIEALAQDKQKAVREQESKLENLITKDSLALKFPNQTNSSIGRFMS